MIIIIQERGILPNILWIIIADVRAFPIQFYHLPVSFSNSNSIHLLPLQLPFVKRRSNDCCDGRKILVNCRCFGDCGGEDSGLGGPGFY